MPIYQYNCMECGHSFENRRTIDDRRNQHCLRCGEANARIVLGSFSLHLFTPHFSQGLGVRVGSRREEAAVCKQMGLENLGDTPLHEIKSEADRHTRWNEERDAAKGPPEDFVRDYYESGMHESLIEPAEAD